MVFSGKQIIRRITLGLSFLSLVLLFAACSIPGISAGSSTTPTAATATPTTSAPTAVPTPSIAVKTYTGTGFSISYPADWKIQTAGTGVVFQDSLGVNDLSIATAPNPGGAASADKLAATQIQIIESSGNVKDASPVKLPATTTVAGETWAQQGITGTATTNGVAVPGELIVLVDNHPASSPTTQAYTITYGGPSATFSQTNAAIFQLMLQTFKFTA